MSTDPLREAIEKFKDAVVFHSGAWFGKQQALADLSAALAVPASETEKLPAKWRADAEACCPSKFEPCNSCKQQLEDATELEAALKADRVGAPTAKP